MGSKGSALSGGPGGGAPWFFLAFLTALRLVVAAWTPLAPDEAYYWVWARAPAWGYYDHPFMVAPWIRVGCALFGDTELGVRVLGPLAAAVGSVLVWRTAEDLLPGRRAGVAAAVLVNATLLFGAGAATMTPETPLLLFWTAALWALGRLLATGNGAWWLVAGLAAGLALDSKYTAALLVPAVLAWLLAVPSLRCWLARPLPWVAALIALAVFAPVLAWNGDHDWVSFAKQGGRAADWQPARALQFLGELIGGQVGLATPVLALLFAAGMVRAVRGAAARDPGWTLLAAVLVVPSAVFVQHALGARVQANWPSLMYPPAAIAAAGLAGGWRRLRAPAAGLGLALTALVWVQGIWAPLPLSIYQDPTLLRLGGWDTLAGSVTAAARREGAAWVAADNYGVAAELAWHMPPDSPVLGLEDRWRWFALPDATPLITGSTGLAVRSARRDGPPDGADFAAVAPAGEVTRVRGGMVAERFRLYLATGRGGPEPVVLLPRPQR